MEKFITATIKSTSEHWLGKRIGVSMRIDEEWTPEGYFLSNGLNEQDIQALHRAIISSKKRHYNKKAKLNKNKVA